jgi:CubicO group peptidase (beta-lactamase class C family)
VLVTRRGKILFAGGFGLANVEERIPCDTHTNFRLASVSKQFTAMAVMLLAEDKRLSLSERLTEFFPEFPDWGRRITVRHLLTHTSGLVDYERVMPRGTTLPLLDRDVLRLLMRQDKTYFPPGFKYRYSNSAYALLSLIVEGRGGCTFAQFLKRRIFEPLQMRGTLAYERGLAAVPNRAFGYALKAGRFVRADQSLTSSVLGDGGIYSSVADLYRWDQALYGRRLVSRKMLDLAFSPHAKTDMPGTGYGFGWYVSHYRGLKEVWHRGSTIGFTTRLVRIPEREFTVIILSNRQNANLARLPHQLADRYLFGEA